MVLVPPRALLYRLLVFIVLQGLANVQAHGFSAQQPLAVGEFARRGEDAGTIDPYLEATTSC
jgi:hypothetical protein